MVKTISILLYVNDFVDKTNHPSILFYDDILIDFVTFSRKKSRNGGLNFYVINNTNDKIINWPQSSNLNINLKIQEN